MESSSSEIALSSSSSTVYSSVAEISSSSSPKISSSSDGECLLDEHIGYMREVGIFPNYTEYVKSDCSNGKVYVDSDVHTMAMTNTSTEVHTFKIYGQYETFFVRVRLIEMTI